MKRGFTLIELLLVISIIGLLSAVTLPAFQKIQANMRDARRQADVAALKIALVQYRTTNGFQFPVPSPNPTCLKSSSGTCWNGYASTDTSLATKLAPFMPSIPPDPSSRSVGDWYVYFSGTTPHGCTGDPAKMVTGNFIIWDPENPTTGSDADCLGQGFSSCCYALNCAVSYYCVTQLDE